MLVVVIDSYIIEPTVAVLRMSGVPWQTGLFDRFQQFPKTRQRLGEMNAVIGRLEQSIGRSLCSEADLSKDLAAGGQNSRARRRGLEELKAMWGGKLATCAIRLSKAEREEFSRKVDSLFPERTMGLPGDDLEQQIAKVFTTDLTGYSGSVAQVVADEKKKGFQTGTVTRGYAFFIENWAREMISGSRRSQLDELVVKLRRTENKFGTGNDGDLLRQIDSLLNEEGIPFSREIDARTKGILRTYFYTVVKEPFYMSPSTLDNLKAASQLVYRAIASATLAGSADNFSLLDDIPSPLIATNSIDFMFKGGKWYITDTAPKATGEIGDLVAIGNIRGESVSSIAAREAELLSSVAERFCLVVPNELTFYRYEADLLGQELRDQGKAVEFSQSPIPGYTNILFGTTETYLLSGAQDGTTFFPDKTYTVYASFPKFRRRILGQIEDQLNELGVYLPREEKVSDIMGKLNVGVESCIGTANFIQYLQDEYGPIVVLRNESVRGSGATKTMPISIYDLNKVLGMMRRADQLVVEECIPPWISINDERYSAEVRVYGGITKR